MNKLITIFAIAGLLTSAVTVPKSSFSISQAAVKEWVLLGERSVTDKIDHDIIPVTVTRHNFRRIRLEVRNHPVRISHLVVHYGNDTSDKLQVSQLIPAGGESRAINLRGGDRVIRKIELWYETKSLAGKQSLVRVYGIR
ncbi:MAG: hypothetical protein N5P05_001005 [Chroococcopsis gigantea SAG 12.99]|jgi:hypothetical protein|nr:DUF2541 family protein [Chlorogloea purpurea SAG 13.99]MDV2999399.1 hypothetical protein [Chroococcopsis gigantea SAG 12.99]